MSGMPLMVPPLTAAPARPPPNPPPPRPAAAGGGVGSGPSPARMAPSGEPFVRYIQATDRFLALAVVICFTGLKWFAL